MKKSGFTLLEVVLAIGLAGAVLGLLTTAIDFYLVRVDASRTQVESAQLARTLLNKIANDLRASRYYAPSSSLGTDDESSSEVLEDTSITQGIFGTATELRIDRSAVWQWERQHLLADTTNPLSTPEVDESLMPQTVRYSLEDGKELLANKLAAAGVGDRPLSPSYAGLYYEQTSTASWLADIATTESSEKSLENAELIAPEVVDIEFAYFDGEQLLEEWDSGLEEKLPSAVEIRLTLLEEPFEQANKRTADDREELRRSKENLVEYRLLVRLPRLSELQEVEFPRPLAQQN